jgi:pyruvate/2-oxoglutarate dehydrogenase complex dihydrolipoamide dehydrogenase (E3) component
MMIDAKVAPKVGFISPFGTTVCNVNHIRTLEVALPDGTSRHLRGTNVIVSTGTRATLGAIPGLAEAQPLTHIEVLELDTVPAHLLVVGGGYVGIELSQAMR